MRIRLFSIGIVFLSLFAAGCGTLQHDPITGQQVRNMYLIEQEVDLGRGVVQSAVAELRQEGIPINQDLATLRTLSNMMHRIAAVSHMPDLPYSVTLVHDDTVNAACAPGGQLIFWEGLWDPKTGLVANENELAFVMAHEIAHATARHTTRTLTREAPMQMALLLAMLGAELADKEDLALGLGVAFALYQGVWLPRYSRRDEHEADRLGLFYMADAGYDPRAAPDIWRRARERHGDSGILAYLSSHPSHRNRYRELERMMPEAMERYFAAINQSSPIVRPTQTVGAPASAAAPKKSPPAPSGGQLRQPVHGGAMRRSN